MRGRWPAWSRPVTALVLGVLVVEVVMVAVLVRGSGAPHRVPVSVVAPPLGGPGGGRPGERLGR